MFYVRVLFALKPPFLPIAVEIAGFRKQAATDLTALAEDKHFAIY